MPFKNRERKLAYQREWYRAHNKRVIAKVKARKHNQYGGTCAFCGGHTIGYGPGRAATFCSKPECKSAARKGRKIFSDAGKIGRAIQLGESTIVLPWAKKHA